MTAQALERRPSRSARKSDTARLFVEISAAVDADERADLVRDVIVVNLGVAQAVARRFRRRGIPDDDLDQVAYVALTRAAQKFEPAEGRDFLSYAVPTISGELKRHFRDHGWTVRPPRRIQEIQSRVIHAYKAGHDADGPPSAARLATQLDLPESDVREALTADGCFNPTSLDRPVRDDTGETLLGLTLASDDSADWRALEARMMLGPALARLSQRDRRVLFLRFVEERTQLQIGDALGVTQMQVSRTLARILKDLRRDLGPEAAIA